MALTALLPATTLLFVVILLPSPVVADGSLPTNLTTLLAPAYLDKATSLYRVYLDYHRSYLLDIGSGLVSSFCPLHHPTFQCQSAPCSLTTKSLQISTCQPSPCHSKACLVSAENPITHKCTQADLSYTNFTLSESTSSIDSKTPLRFSFPHILSSCAPSELLQHLPANTSGTAGLSRSNLSLPSLLTPWIGKKFGFCLSIDDRAGVVYFGNAPYMIVPELDGAAIVTYAPLVTNPSHPVDYYVPLTAFKASVFANSVPGFNVPINGWTKLSTTVPYTILSAQVYKAFIDAFTNAVSGRLTRIRPVKPFELCYRVPEYYLSWDLLEDIIPSMDLVMSDGAVWKVHDANSMKFVSRSAICLAFINGGADAENAVVFGLHQMQETFMLFDLEGSRVGLSANMYFYETYCPAHYIFDVPIA